MIHALLLLWLALLVSGDTRAGRMLRHALVVGPARWLSRWTRGELLLLLLGALFAATVLWVMEEEGGVLLAMIGPELIGWMAMFDIGALLDAALVTVTMASVLRLRDFRQAILRRLPRPRAPRSRRAVRPRSIDPEDGPFTFPKIHWPSPAWAG